MTMSRIPKLRFKEFSGKWEEKTITEVLKIGSGKDYKHLASGDIPVYGTGGYMTSVDGYLYDGESVCIGRKGTIDKPMFIRGKFWTVDTLFYTHSFKNVIPKFIYLIFQNINWKFYNEASGVPSLSKSTIESIGIVLPTEIEQQKIASFLSAIDTKIDQLTRKKELLELYKKGVMQKIFSQELRFNGDEKSHWRTGALKDFGSFYYGKSAPKSSITHEAKTPCVRYGELYSTYTENITNIYSYTNIEPTNLKFSKGGEILIPRVGEDPLDFANCSYLSIPNVAIGEMISVFNTNENGLYLTYYFNAMLKKQFARYVEGANPANLYFRYLENIEICIPSFEEQTKIANFFSAIDTKIDFVAKQLDEAKNFKKGLLQQMFV